MRLALAAVVALALACGKSPAPQPPARPLSLVVCVTVDELDGACAKTLLAHTDRPLVVAEIEPLGETTIAAVATYATLSPPWLHGCTSVKELGAHGIGRWSYLVQDLRIEGDVAAVAAVSLRQLSAPISSLDWIYEEFHDEGVPASGRPASCEETWSKVRGALGQALAEREFVRFWIHFADLRSDAPRDGSGAAPILSAQLAPHFDEFPELERLCSRGDLDAIENVIGRHTGSPVLAAYRIALRHAAAARIGATLDEIVAFADSMGVECRVEVATARPGVGPSVLLTQNGKAAGVQSIGAYGPPRPFLTPDPVLDVAEPGSGATALDCRDDGCILSLERSAGVWIGSTPLAGSWMPRLPERSGAAWPETDPWTIDVRGRSPGRAEVGVGDSDGQVGLEVELLLARVPGDRPEEELSVRVEGGGSVEPVSGRLDAVWLRGTTPLTFTCDTRSGHELAIAARVDGEDVPIQAMRYYGRRWTRGPLLLYVPEWMLGVTEELEHPGGPLEDGVVARLRRDPDPLRPNGGRPLSPDDLRFVMSLGDDE